MSASARPSRTSACEPRGEAPTSTASCERVAAVTRRCALQLDEPGAIDGARVLLVDDRIVTGWSLTVAAAALHEAGAELIAARRETVEALAAPYRDAAAGLGLPGTAELEYRPRSDAEDADHHGGTPTEAMSRLTDKDRRGPGGSRSTENGGAS